MRSASRIAALSLALAATLAACTASLPAHHLAIANGNHLRVVNTSSGQEIADVSRYREIMRLAYRADGSRLAVGECLGNRVVELDTSGYGELAAPLAGASCPWDVGYSPDGQSLAAAMPVRPTPLGSLAGHVQVAGPSPLDRDLGRPLPAVAYRPGGGEIAVATPQGVTILGPAPAYASVLTVPGLLAQALDYTTDGDRLIAGTGAGFTVLDATQGYAPVLSDTSGAVLAVAVAPAGGWLALVRAGTVSVRRSADLVEVASLASTVGFRAADFSRDGALLAVAEQRDQVRLLRAPAWAEVPAIARAGRLDAVAFRPQALPRIPVLFVHGAESGVGPTWFEPGADTSAAAALAANPQLPIDAFYMALPLHTSPQPHGVADDAMDILAAIEGGADSRGAQHVGILNLPAYQTPGRVAVVAYSLGTISTRYYLKTLMGSRRGQTVTVSEFVTLASPNHGIALHGTQAMPVACGVSNQQDRIGRQLCGGRRASLITDLAPCCGAVPPATFTSNLPGDETFLQDLNGHSLSTTCNAQPVADSEAPHSRPTEPGGVLYVNLYAAGNLDLLVGGDTQTLDCLGRRLARNLATDAVNHEIANVPGGLAGVHENFPHHWETLCMALRTVVDHQAPSPAQACLGLTRP